MTTQLYTLSDAEFNQLVCVPWQLGESLRTRINAAFALGIERARKVKPLTWLHFKLRDMDLWIVDGEHYEVKGAGGLFSAKSGPKVLNGQCTADEAKSACQAHHEQFVLSQLEQL